MSNIVLSILFFAGLFKPIYAQFGAKMELSKENYSGGVSAGMPFVSDPREKIYKLTHHFGILNKNLKSLKSDFAYVSNCEFTFDSSLSEASFRGLVSGNQFDDTVFDIFPSAFKSDFGSKKGCQLLNSVDGVERIVCGVVNDLINAIRFQVEICERDPSAYLFHWSCDNIFDHMFRRAIEVNHPFKKAVGNLYYDFNMVAESAVLVDAK